MGCKIKQGDITSNIMEKYEKVLTNCALFKEISKEDLKALLICLNAKLHSFKKNEGIFFAGKPLDHIAIVLEGKVQIIFDDYYGNRNIIAHIDPSEFFGESFACSQIDAIPVDVVACEASSILLIDVKRITQLCNHSCPFHQQLTLNLIKAMSLKNIYFNQKLEILSKRNTREKLLTYLLFESKKHNSSAFTISYDRQQLADYLSVDRSGLSMEISKLCKENIIRNKKNYFELLK